MGTLMRVPVKTGATFERGASEKVMDALYLVRQPGGPPGRMYDVWSSRLKSNSTKTQRRLHDGQPANPHAGTGFSEARCATW